MSKRAWMLFGCALALAVPAQLSAQTARELREARLAMQDSLRATQQRMGAYVAARTVQPSTADSVAGLVYRYPEALIATRDRAAIHQGVLDAQRQLRAQFGESADDLLRRIRWQISAPSTSAQSAQVLMITSGRQPDGSEPRLMLGVPVRAEEVAAATLQDAARAVVNTNTTLWSFARTAFALLPNDRAPYVSYRELVSTGTPDTRRCLRGEPEACAAAMGVTMPGATATGRPIQAQVSLRLRGSLLGYVLETRGGTALSALLRERGSDSRENPIALLAEAADLPPEALIAAWRETLSEAPARNAALHPGLVAVALFWSLLFGLLSAQRRPQ